MSEGRGTRSAASRHGRRFSLCVIAVAAGLVGWSGTPVSRGTGKRGYRDTGTAFFGDLGTQFRYPGNPVTRSPAASGTISGNVVVSTTLAARRPDFRIYADPGTGSIPPSRSHDQLTAELKNVVIYLDGDSTTLPASSERLERYRHGSIAQRDERFVPHVLPVLRGAVVQFPNEDNVYHNVFSLSSEAAPNGKGFDLGRYPKGSSKSWTFDRPGTVLVFCHIHQDMSAVVLVLPNPYFASPGDDHHYVIDDVPPGDYTILGWHERAKLVTKKIHVVAGQTTTMDFNIPLAPAPRP